MFSFDGVVRGYERLIEIQKQKISKCTSLKMTEGNNDLIYYSEMLFNYNKCECCKNSMNDVNITLYKLLPANLCNKISEYNVYCNQTRDLEHFFLKNIRIRDIQNFNYN